LTFTVENYVNQETCKKQPGPAFFSLILCLACHSTLRVPPKRRGTCIEVHGVTSQKIVVITRIAEYRLQDCNALILHDYTQHNYRNTFHVHCVAYKNKYLTPLLSFFILSRITYRCWQVPGNPGSFVLYIDLHS
jgi:hypothetical protein